MAKPLKIKSSARYRRRYLLVRGSKGDIEKAILEYIGILGWAKAAPFFVKTGDVCVLAVNREELDKVLAAFEASPANLVVARVSGTLKGLKK